MTSKTYHVSNVLQFLALTFPLPANSLVFWSKGEAGGVLLLAGVHYFFQGTVMVIAAPVSVGDTITVVTFP